ncbi:MAG TPA: patatin-like phospholipase family protein [Allosphingosinicella sp.]|nr:patatin-like phospholipase family protein [Allosphingosinicella sp.]
MATSATQQPCDPEDSGKVKVVGTERVLLDEYAGFWPNDPQAPADEAGYRRRAFEQGQAALCLSGGGIRSAAFALGVLQALSAKRLLTGFHYLSTVSGGGYIGSWLQRWIHEEPGGAETVMVRLGGVTEPAEVSALRENSNFITPRVGIGSNDTWTALSISGRNIALNWLLFAPLLMFVTVFPNLFAASVLSLPYRTTLVPELPLAPLLFSAAFAWAAAWHVVRQLPSYRAGTSVKPNRADFWLNLRIVLPLVGWAIAGTLSIGIDLFSGKPLLVAPGLALALTSLVASVMGLIASGLTLPEREEPDHWHPLTGYRQTFFNDLPLWIGALVLAAVVTVFGAAVFQRWLGPDIAFLTRHLAEATHWHHNQRSLSPVALLTVLGPLWLMATQLLIAIVFAGFRNATGRTVRPDADREWLARLSAVKIKPMLLWGTVGFAVLILDWALRRYIPGYDMSLSGMIALVSGFVAVAGGKSSKSGNSTSTVQGIGGFVLKHVPMQGLIAAGTGLFILMLFLILGRIEQNSAEWIASGIGKLRLPKWVDPYVVAHFVVLAGLLAALMFLGRRIQVNRFSLNGLYRNRLARAFLGGARLKREPDPFTGFDAGDNVRMHMLAASAGGRRVLYPVINVALNVTASEKLAWQERKAEPFVFTPRYSGSGMLKPPEWPPEGAAVDLNDPPGAYVASHVYGGNEPDLAMAGCGVSLATAMSISGAAASPNMGYHTSAATALLMTLFNVRLGAWLPNPAQGEKMGDAVRASGPSNSLFAILRELGGATDDRGRDIYLSDGGHFENLGLYEMVRRRCRYIVVSDAGADPECAFSDLGGAVRKVKIDFDVDISFDALDIHPRDPDNRERARQRAFALGTIEYPESRYAGSGPEDPEARKRRTGRLLYIKPSYFGQLPVDVRSYAEVSRTFPHESTADQFFSESQFESYRRLGYFFTSALGGDFDARRFPDDPVGRFFEAIDAQLEVAQEAEEARTGLVARAVRAAKRKVGLGREEE